ncbi:unnamed protein product, partial [Staurois parvus]
QTLIGDQWKAWQRGVADTDWRVQWRNWQRGVADTDWRPVQGLAERGGRH